MVEGGEAGGGTRVGLNDPMTGVGGSGAVYLDFREEVRGVAGVGSEEDDIVPGSTADIGAVTIGDTGRGPSPTKNREARRTGSLVAATKTQAPPTTI